MTRVTYHDPLTGKSRTIAVFMNRADAANYVLRAATDTLNSELEYTLTTVTREEIAEATAR